MTSTTNKLILVIDDSADNLTLLETLLGSNGWSVDTASDGAEALALLEQSPRLPDLILLDLQMPGMSGARFRIEQRRIERIKDIPVIVMSGCIDEKEVGAIHANGRLCKPLNLRTIVKSVNSFLNPIHQCNFTASV
jgi:CheY-like chemotaxis protein